MLIKSLIPAEIKTAWQIVAICESPTECQVDDLLSSLEAGLAKQAKAMRQMLVTAAFHGPKHFHDDVCHKIAEDIYQFRKGDIRVAWFYDGTGKIVVCCQAFIKKTNKTPPSFIQRAVACLQEYKLQRARGAITEISEG